VVICNATPVLQADLLPIYLFITKCKKQSFIYIHQTQKTKNKNKKQKTKNKKKQKTKNKKQNKQKNKIAILCSDNGHTVRSSLGSSILVHLRSVVSKVPAIENPDLKRFAESTLQSALCSVLRSLEYEM
jgi:hypothetical protein